MRRLILIKHSLPEIDRQKPAANWPLSVAGRARSVALAKHVRPYAPTRIFSSREPKAAETAQIVAEQLGLSFQLVDDLHEHDRRDVRWAEREPFEVAVRQFFAEPDKLVMGHETADEAHARFTRAVNLLVERHPTERLAIVAHGTVITLLVARLMNIEPFAFWQRLGLPAIVALEWPGPKLLAVVESIEVVDDA